MIIAIADIRIGDTIHAIRRERSRIYNNFVVGPVSEIYGNAIRIRCNAGTDIETEWTLWTKDWDFRLLFTAAEVAKIVVK